MYKDPTPETLIKKYIEGSLTLQESEELVTWINEHPGHRKTFDLRCKNSHPEPNAALEKSYQILLEKRRIREETAEIMAGIIHPGNSQKIAVLGKKILRYAAIFLLGAAGMFIARQITVHNRADVNGVKWITAQTESGQKSRITLPDSSVVWLNAETTLSFPAEYISRKNRIVKVEGEAYFKVSDQGKNTFTVRSRDYDIRVRGTEFNVMAYEDFKRTETTLIEGSVDIRRSGHVLKMEPGERVVFAGNTMTKSKGRIRQASLWKENKFYFDNVPFNELIRRLERWYDVDIELVDQELSGIYYSGYFKNQETVWQVLDVIKMTTPIEYERKEFRQITITSKNMN